MILLLLAPFVPISGVHFTCTPTHVWDGDGAIWCKEGEKIRLAGIAAREIDESCKRSHPCPAASGRAARDELVSLIGEPVGVGAHGHVLVAAEPMECLSFGSGKGARTAAWCRTAKGIDLSCAMIGSGMALRWKQYGGDRVCSRW